MTGSFLDLENATGAAFQDPKRPLILTTRVWLVDQLSTIRVA